MSLILAKNPNARNDIPLAMDIGNVRAETYGNTSVPQRRVLTQTAPSSGIASNVINGGNLEFKLENQVDRIGSAYVKVDYTNASGAAFVCSTCMMHIESIQIYANNGSTLLYQDNNSVSHFLMDATLLSRNEWENIAGLRGTDANYSTAVQTIADGAQGSFYYCLSPNFWRSIKFRSYCVDGNLLVRIRFQPGANIIQSGTFTTTSAVLLTTGYMEAEGQRKLLLSRANNLKAFGYYAPQLHKETINLTGGNTVPIRLSGISGWVNQMAFAIRPVASASSPALQFTFVRPQSFDILDPSQKSLTGFKAQTMQDMILLYSHGYDNLFINKTNACVYSFSQSPVADVASSNWHGGVEMRGDHYLQITLPTGWVAGSYEITIVAVCNESLTIDGGKATSTRA